MTVNLNVPEWFLITMCVLAGVNLAIQGTNIYLNWRLKKASEK